MRKLEFRLPEFAEPIRPVMEFFFPPDEVPTLGMGMSEGVKTLIPKDPADLAKLAKSIVGKDYFGFDSLGQALGAIRNNADWADRWVPDTPAEGQIIEAWRKSSLASTPLQPSEGRQMMDSLRQMFIDHDATKRAAKDAAATASRRTFKVVE